MTDFELARISWTLSKVMSGTLWRFTALLCKFCLFACLELVTLCNVIRLQCARFGCCCSIKMAAQSVSGTRQGQGLDKDPRPSRSEKRQRSPSPIEMVMLRNQLEMKSKEELVDMLINKYHELRECERMRRMASWRWLDLEQQRLAAIASNAPDHGDMQR